MGAKQRAKGSAQYQPPFTHPMEHNSPQIPKSEEKGSLQLKDP
jgi:hypothetical protein